MKVTMREVVETQIELTPEILARVTSRATKEVYGMSTPKDSYYEKWVQRVLDILNSGEF